MSEQQEQQPWLVRQYDPASDDLRYLLSVGYTRSKAGVRAGASDAGKKSSGVVDHEKVARERAFMAAHQPIWNWLLENADVRVVCDADAPDIVYAWAITSEPNVVHVVGAKFDAAKSGLAKEMVEELLGDRLTTPQVCTLELPQLPGERPSGTLPSGSIMQRPPRWYSDLTWLAVRLVGGAR